MAQAHKNLNAELTAHEKRWQISNQSWIEMNGNANTCSAGNTHLRDCYALGLRKTFVQNMKETIWFQYVYTYINVFIKQIMKYSITITLFSIAARLRQTVSLWDADPSSWSWTLFISNAQCNTKVLRRGWLNEETGIRDSSSYFGHVFMHVNSSEQLNRALPLRSYPGHFPCYLFGWNTNMQRDLNKEETGIKGEAMQALSLIQPIWAPITEREIEKTASPILPPTAKEWKYLNYKVTFI